MIPNGNAQIDAHIFLVVAQNDWSSTMQRIDKDEVLDRLKRMEDAGFNVDDRLFREVKKPGQMFLFSLPDTNAFFHLLWQSIDETRCLAPLGQSRTLFDCASRLAAWGWRFDNLTKGGHSWFGKCVEIDSCFDYSKFGWLALTICNSAEREGSPTGTYYIYDGVHKSIVLAKKLLNSEIGYTPLEALLLTPRRS